MNILYFIPYISKKDGGIYQYSLSLLESLSVDTQNNYYIYHLTQNPEIEEIIKNKRNFFHVGIGKTKENVIYFIIRNLFKVIDAILIFYRYNIKLPKISPLINILKGYKIDIIHCPFQAIPENVHNIPVISTMHDVQDLHFPSFFTPEQRVQRAINSENIISNSDTVIVSYQHIKSDIIKYFNKPEDKVQILKISVKNLWFKPFIGKEIQSDLINNIPENYILYPAITWKHKNHINLIKAIKILKDKGRKVNLLCTGGKTKFYQDISDMIKSLKLEENISFLGIVNNEDLYNLYINSKGVVIPTFYEAGSYVLMESIILNIPVICSNVTSLPETIENEDYIFDPYNIDEIANKIELLLFDENFRKSNIQNSKRIAVENTNDELLTNLFKIYHKLIYKQVQ
ncbi:MAG: glycosyltransferase family 1 protein [Bacteroidota bacterium]|nr:glycosyltransferase family 1 protein [Bacteroidota bacterium]